MVERLAVLVAVLVVAGCGGDDGGTAEPTPTPTVKPVGKVSQGSVVQYADCRDWNRGTDAEKRATVVALRGQLTAQTSKTAQSRLSDERAVGLLEQSCGPEFARSLRLYKLYARAQAFAPLAED